MTVSFGNAVKNARRDAVEATVGTAPKFRFYTGTPPANAEAALSSNNLIAELTLPSDWLTAGGSAGQSVLNGSWTGTASLAGTNTATFYRIYNTAGSTCHEQGTVSATGGGGDLQLDSTSITQNQTITITTFTKNEGN